MPAVPVNGEISLYYESRGQGKALVLLSGIGYGGWLWQPHLPILSKHYRVLIFDNRGVGLSDKPDEIYTIDTFVHDTVGLLNALGIKQAHLLGASLGGMIALQLALAHPGRVDRLVLCSTAFGGPHVVLPSLKVVQFMAQPTGSAEERFTRGLQLAFSPGFIEKNPEIADLIRQKLAENRQPDYAYSRQVMAPLNFNVEPELGKIQRPVLVMAGERDVVVPVENARRLAEKLPNAQWKIFKNAGHLFFLEEPDLFQRAVLDFLNGNSSEKDHHEN